MILNFILFELWEFHLLSIDLHRVLFTSWSWIHNSWCICIFSVPGYSQNSHENTRGLQQTNPRNILHLAFPWEALRKTREQVKKSLAAVMVNFSPVPPGCCGGLYSHDRPLGSAAQQSGLCIWAVILFVCVSEETAVQLIFPCCGLPYL